MIVATFSADRARWVSFEVRGHAGYADSGSDIVCAAVTSCVEMTANTLTEVLRVPAKVEVGGDRVAVKLDGPCEGAGPLMEGLYQHLCLLAGQYPDCVRVLKSD